jgi:REP element-mobilizing transposase RayT
VTRESAQTRQKPQPHKPIAMILAYHSIFSMYGFWLPNDPRGSGSDYVAQWELFRYGAATKTNSRQSVAHLPRRPAWQAAAKSVLRHPPVILNGKQALKVIEGFAQACREANYRVYACAILPNHVHMVIGAHVRPIRQIVGHLKGRATQSLRDSDMWPDERPLWGGHGWNVRLESAVAVERAIRYVEENPLKEGKKRQIWRFIIPFVEQEAIEIALQIARQRRNTPKRRVGGAALHSVQAKAARRERRG